MKVGVATGAGACASRRPTQERVATVSGFSGFFQAAKVHGWESTNRGYPLSSPEMAVRLSKVFGGSAESWLVQQAQHDLAHVAAHRIKLKRLEVA